MNLLVAENLTKSYTGRLLFSDISFGINEGERIGLIGINGTGKSTLLRIIAEVEEADSGAVTRRNGLRIAFLPQNPEFDNEISILDNVCQGQIVSESYRNVRGEAAAMLVKLGIDDVYVSPSILSGGQRKRASLVKTLLSESDLLILDEPTNHLDSEMTEWLEEWLSKYNGALLMVTHDRYFLDEVTNRIIELDRSHLYSYQTNYSGFVELKAEREAYAEAAERKNRSLYKQELAWMLRGARARSTKQKAHIQRFEKLRDRKIEVPDGTVEMTSVSSRLGKKIVEINSISKAYGDKVLVKDYSYILTPEDRIGIIGPNGCGKSTLIGMLTGDIAPDTGKVEYGSTVKFGIFAQECGSMDPNTRVIDYVKEEAEMVRTKDGYLTASKLCENFLFDAELQYQPIAKLSGGEKRRLYLLRILMSAPNVLILDEPTNDLDITTLTILEDYLLGFDGVIITVSHDRYFLDKLVNRIFVFEGDGKIGRSEGNYTDYRERILEEADNENAVKGKGAGSKNSNSASKSEAPLSGSAATWKNGPKKLKFSYAEQKEFDTIDDVIAGLEADIEELESKISAATSDYFTLNSLMAEKDVKEKELEEKMERWVYLNDLAEKIRNQ